MSTEALAWAFEVQVGHPTRKLILIALADHCDHLHRCWPSQAKLATRAECSVDTVQRHLASLVEQGLVTRQRRDREGGGRTSDLYILQVESLSRNLRPRDKAAPVRGGATAMVRQEPSLEPSIKREGAERGLGSEERIRWEGADLVLSNEERSDWLKDLFPDEASLALAVQQSAGYVHARSGLLLLRQARGQLARIARERREKDARYGAAAKQRRGAVVDTEAMFAKLRAEAGYAP